MAFSYIALHFLTIQTVEPGIKTSALEFLKCGTIIHICLLKVFFIILDHRRLRMYSTNICQCKCGISHGSQGATLLETIGHH